LDRVPDPRDNGPAARRTRGEPGGRPDGDLLPFDEFIAYHAEALIGARIWDAYGKWPVFAKFFDNEGALPFHVHHRDEDASPREGRQAEAYYYSRR